MITKEYIEEILSKSGIKLLEYAGSLDRGCTIQYSNGEIKRLSRTDKLFYRHKKKHSGLIKEKSIGKYEEAMNEIGYEITNKDEDRFKLKCIKHDIEFSVKRDNIRKMLRGKRNNPYFCPECKKNHMWVRIETECENIKVIKEVESDISHRKFLLECNRCNHQFERFSSDIFGQKTTSCPKCKPYKDRHNPFFKSFEEYSEYVRRLTDLNINRYGQYIIIKERNELHLDHKFSINDGYDNHLPPWMIACPINLEYLTDEENLKKHKKSSITLKELLNEFNKFLEVEESYLKLFDTP